MAMLPDITGISYTTSNLNWMAYTGSADGAAATVGGSLNPANNIDTALMSASRVLVVTINSSTADATAFLINTSGVTAAAVGSALQINASDMNGVVVTALDSRYAMVLCYRVSGGNVFAGVIDTDADVLSVVGGSLTYLAATIGTGSGQQFDIDGLTSTTAICCFRNTGAANILSGVVLTANTGTGAVTAGTAVDMSAAGAARDDNNGIKVKAISATRFVAVFTTAASQLNHTCGTVSGTTVTAVDLAGNTVTTTNPRAMMINLLDTNTWILSSMIHFTPQVGLGLSVAYTDGGGASTLVDSNLVGIPGRDAVFVALDSDTDYDYGVVFSRAIAGATTAEVRGARIAKDKNMIEVAKTAKSLGADTVDFDPEHCSLIKVSTSKVMVVYDAGSTIKAYIASR
jgi:hypothetical protein